MSKKNYQAKEISNSFLNTQSQITTNVLCLFKRYLTTLYPIKYKKRSENYSNFRPFFEYNYFVSVTVSPFTAFPAKSGTMTESPDTVYLNS